MSIKRKIATYFLKKKLVDRSREAKAINLNSAKSIGIMYEVGEHRKNVIVEQFIEKLRNAGKQIYSIGFVRDYSKNNDFKISMNEYYYTKKDLNWLGFPNTKKIGKFLARDFDILIDLNENNYFSTEHILARSKAKLKVGKTGGYKDEYCDMLIAINGNNTSYLIEQITNYLSKINSHEAA